MSNNQYTNMQIAKNSRIFVAGGTGLVGSAIIKKLLEKGYNNIISNYHNRIPNTLITNNQSTNILMSNDKYTNSQPTWVQLDLTNQQLVNDFFKAYSPEFVFLAAARVGGILANDTYKADFIYDNIVIASNIIHAAYKYGVKKLLNLGSSCIYPKFAEQPMKEEYLLTSELEPTNEPYAIAKIAAIKLCRYFNEQYKTNFLSVMPTNLYGPNDNFDLEKSHVLPALLRKIHLGKCLEENDWKAIRKDLNGTKIVIGNLSLVISESSSKEDLLKVLNHFGIKYIDNQYTNKQITSKVSVEIWGSGNPFREFLYVDDMADACVFVMENVEVENMRKLSLDYFVNIGTGKDIKIKDLVELIKKIVDFKGAIEYDTSKPDGTPRKLLDVGKINQLGWSAKTGLEEGIRKVYKWYRSC